MLEVRELAVWPRDLPNSSRYFEILEDGERLAYWGYVAGGLVGECCSVWAQVEQEPKDRRGAALLTRRWLNTLHQYYTRVGAFVACDNERNQRWLQSLGFIDMGIGPAYPEGRLMISVRGR